MITVILPTITGREHWLERCISAYKHATETPIRFQIVKNAATWGDGINQGMGRRIRGAYVHFTADDIEPHPGWDVAAIEAVKHGCLPAPRILNADGSLQTCGEGTTELADWQETAFSRVPFLSRAQWEKIGPMPDNLHYYTDNWISWRGHQQGWNTVVRRDYLLTHHWAPEGRLDHRFNADGARYRELVS